MLHYHHLDKVDLTLVNWKKIFSIVQRKFINDCEQFGYLKDDKINLKKTDVKRLLIHYIIHEMCEEIINSKHKCKDIVLYRPLTTTDTFEILKYCDITKLNEILMPIMLQMKKILPIQIAILDKNISFHTLKERLDKEDGEITELIYKILCNMTPINISFEKIKKYAKKNKLSFLSKDYFNQLKTKQLFYN